MKSRPKRRAVASMAPLPSPSSSFRPPWQTGNTTRVKKEGEGNGKGKTGGGGGLKAFCPPRTECKVAERRVDTEVIAASEQGGAEKVKEKRGESGSEQEVVVLQPARALPSFGARPFVSPCQRSGSSRLPFKPPGLHGGAVKRERDDDGKENLNVESVNRAQSVSKSRREGDGVNNKKCGSVRKKRYFRILLTKRSAKKRRNKSWVDGFLVMDEESGNVQVLDMEGKVLQRSKLGRKDRAGVAEDATVHVGTLEVEIEAEVEEKAVLSGAAFLAHNAEDSLRNPLVERTSAFLKPFVAVKASNGSGLTPSTSSASAASASAATASTAKVLDPHSPPLIDPYLDRHLRPHQRTGVNFMYKRVMASKHSGCILADAMGLGKTLQVITLLWTLMRHAGAKGGVDKAVVCVPSSLVTMWAAEVKKWLGNERLVARAVLADKFAKDGVDKFCESRLEKVLVISYDLIRKYASQLSKLTPGIGLLICDEAHRLKTSGGNKTIAALESLNCNRRVLVTGTPLQNNLMEFHAMLAFAVGGFSVLGTPAAFQRLFVEPIAKSKERDAPPDVLLTGEERGKELTRLTQSYMLRRTAEVLRSFLPPKTEYTIFTSLSFMQRELYQRLTTSPAVKAALRGGGDIAGAALPLIALLVQVATHPWCACSGAKSGKDGGAGVGGGGGRGNKALHAKEAPSEEHEMTPDAARKLLDTHDGSATINDIRNALKCLWINAKAGGSVTTGKARGHLDYSPVTESGKLSVALAIICSAMEKRERIVVSSGSTKTLDYVEYLCKKKNFDLVRLDGSTPPQKRDSAVQRFNNGTDTGLVFLLSKRAGGVGLTLIGGNHLICLEADWNPAIDAQVLGRVWRDGQKKPVSIYRLLSSNTIDEKMFQRQISKGDVATSILGDGGGGAAEEEGGDAGNVGDVKAEAHFTKAELLALFKYNPKSQCATHELLHKAGSEHAQRWTNRVESVQGHMREVVAATREFIGYIQIQEAE